MTTRKEQIKNFLGNQRWSVKCERLESFLAENNQDDCSRLIEKVTCDMDFMNRKHQDTTWNNIKDITCIGVKAFGNTYAKHYVAILD